MDRIAFLETAFNPSSVAIAGVGGPTTSGRLYMESLLKAGYTGKIYPMHPNGGEVAGFEVYPNVNDVPEPVDLVISCLPARLLPGLIGDCARKGVKVVHLFTAGFSETGSEEGRRLEAKVVRLAREGGVRIIGPNCMGVYDPKAGLSFVFDFPRDSGGIALICQSGGHTIYFVRAGARRGIRFSKVVSYGNALDVNETDLLEYLIHDPETEMVAAYLEGVKDGGRFRRVLGELCAAKPVAVLKGGSSQAGARTAASHTSSLAGSDEVWDGLLRQAGAIRVDTLEELIDLAVTFQFLRVPQGRRVVMVGGGGGSSVVATDTCIQHGFMLPSVPQAVSENIKASLDSLAGRVLTNPVEIGMSLEEAYTMASTLFRSEVFDLLLCYLVFEQPPWPLFDPWFKVICDVIARVNGDIDKPAAMIMHSDISAEREMFLDLERQCYEAGVPVYHSVSGACLAIDRFIRYHNKRSLQ